MKIFLLGALVLVVIDAVPVDQKWQDFKLKYAKTYKSLLEERKRHTIFQDNVKEIEEHNAKYANGEVSYSLGINQFTDMTDDEFKAYLWPMHLDSEVGEIYNNTSGRSAESINWVEQGLVTPVKNEGKCDASWAFSAVGSIEGQIAKKTGVLASLAAQNLVDCSSVNNGCDGGSITESFKYIMKYGVFPDAEYPFTGHRGACRNVGGQKIADFVRLAQNEDVLLSALTEIGPISVSIDGEQLRRYSNGIFDVSSGCRADVTHSALLVGAGTENGKDYWLIKNSWGTKWGIQGYFKLARGKNACAINLNNAYPKL